ncbi:MAG: permease, partial [bacterium]
EVSLCCGDSNKEETSTSCCGGDSSCDNNIEASNLKRAFNSSIETLKSMFKYIVMGIGVGAFVHGFVPEEVIQSLLGEGNPIAPIMATLVGIPIYADDVALIPIAKTLVDGGAGLGTALAFVMSSSVVSIPSFIMLGSVLKKQTLVKLAIYLSIAIIIIGYIFNFVAPIVL